MKRIWTHAAPAVGLVLAAGAANAKIAPPGSGNGELVFSVWDVEREISYALDLGMHLDDFEPSDLTDPAFSIIWAADALLQQFLADSAAAGNTVEWNVLVGDSRGPGNRAGQRRLALTLDPAVTEAQIEQARSSDLNTANNLLNYYINELNDLPTHNTDVNGDHKKNFLDNGSSIWAFDGEDGEFVADASFSGGSLSALSGELGESLNFWFVANTGNQNAFVDATAYGILAAGEFLYSTFTFMDDGTLVFAVPVPEAETWALLGLGLIGVGALARRRAPAPLALA